MGVSCICVGVVQSISCFLTEVQIFLYPQVDEGPGQTRKDHSIAYLQLGSRGGPAQERPRLRLGEDRLIHGVLPKVGHVEEVGGLLAQILFAHEC